MGVESTVLVGGSSRLAAPVKLRDQQWPEGTRPLVSVLCFVYTHRKYLEECLNGFLFQETTFPVEIILHDDASTDDSQVIIRQFCKSYPHLFRAVFQEENQYSRGNMPDVLAFPHASGDYIATCEGDDYWTLPSKLQQQVETFERHPECILCGGRVAVIREGRPTPYKIDPSQEPEILAMLGPMEMLKGKWAMRTVSRMARRDVWADYVEGLKGSSISCDYLFMLYCISVSGMRQQAFHCVDEVVGVYREGKGGIWFSRTEKEQDRTNLDIVRYALKFFNFNGERRHLEWTLYLTLKRTRETFQDKMTYLKLKLLFSLRPYKT